jgi:hypothetical protein
LDGFRPKINPLHYHLYIYLSDRRLKGNQPSVVHRLDTYMVMYMTHLKEIKYRMKYTPVLFDFKAKKIEFGEDMTAEIMVNEL